MTDFLNSLFDFDAANDSYIRKKDQAATARHRGKRCGGTKKDG